MASNHESWASIERRLFELMNKEDIRGALQELDQFLATRPGDTASLTAALSYRGMLKEEAGDIDGAIDDNLRAHSFAERGTYSRYVLEVTLGCLYTITGPSQTATSWLHSALHTVLEATDISGGSALRKFVRLKNGMLNPADEALCREVVIRSWKVLRQNGEPRLTDLEAIAQKLTELESKPLSE